MKRWVVGLFLGLSACNSPRTMPPSKPLAAPQTTPVKPRTIEFLDRSLGFGTDIPYPACDRPERWLAYVPRDEFRETYCGRCSCSSEDTSRPEWPWSFDVTATGSEAGLWCNERQYVHHTIAAEWGIAPPPGRFARYFGYQSHYQPQWIERSDLPEVARKNLAWADALVQSCNTGSEVPPVSNGDLKRIDEWFDKNYAGSPELPAKLYSNCQPTKRDEFREMLQSGNFLRYTPRTPVTAAPDEVCIDLVPRGGRTLVAHVGASLTPHEEMEGHQRLHFVLDARGALVALVETLSG